MRERNDRLSGDDGWFDEGKARYAIGILNLLIDVVGSQTLLGTMLSDTRTEIVSLLESTRPGEYDDDSQAA